MCAEITSLYGKLREEVDRRGFIMKEVPKDGDCALHAVVDQMRQNDEHILVHSVESLRRSAVQLLEKHLLT